MRMTLFCPPARHRDQVSLLASCRMLWTMFSEKIWDLGKAVLKWIGKWTTLWKSSSVYFEECEMATTR